MEKQPYENKMDKTPIANKVKQLGLDQRVKALKKLDPNSEHLAIMEMRDEHAKKFLK